ncbi:MAG TPA: hypothetical protein VMX15_06460, partial [Candidatus Heimdallarchaeota archaeon]|nr:hypothetical protein [Candidatus Heimdallarchaeota archaeon]
MSDLRLPRLAARVIERTSRQPRGAMTDYERELDPIYDVEMQEELRKRRRLQPLQKIFDILQIGQYVSANVADEIANAILYSRDPSRGNPWEPGDILQAVIDGITGQRKGSYENVLRDTLQVGTQKILPNAPEGTWRANVDYADLLGFIGDVALDPLTYVSFGGSSKGARIAADAFADDAVRLLGKQLAQNPEQLAKITRGKWTQEALQAATGADDVTKAFRQIMRQNDDLGRLFSQTYAEAQKRALNRTAAQLPGLAEDIVGRGAGTRGGIDDILRKAGEGAYEHAGERFKLRVLGKEVGIGEATQLADWRRRSWETFTGFLKQQPGVVNVRNAIWGAMNRGIVGEVKRVMGIRNPYQKYLRSLEREAGEFAVTDASVKLLDEGVTPIFKLSEPEQVAVRDLLASRETAAKAALVAGDARTVAAAASPIVVDPKIAASADQLRSVIDSWQQRANEIAQELGESPLTYYQEYIPEVFRFRSGSAIQRMGREYTFSEQMTKESNLMQFVFGVDKDTADMVVKNNLSGFSTDLRELMAAKALQQAKIENRYRMVQTFKEFGIDMNDFPAHMKSQIQVGGNQVLETPLKMGGRDITQLGLRNIDHPALQNYLFDYDVAEIFDRALKVTSTDRTQIGKMFSAYMSWWKGMVLLNSGYTLRNFYSNTMTQFLRHGPRAFNPKEIEKSIAATLHIMKKTDPKNLGRALESIGKNESWLESMLNTRIGPRLTLRDLSEQGYQRGVISENVFGFDAKDIVEKVSGKTKQPIRLVARKVNTFVENIPRFQSFLIDYVDNVGAEAAEESVLKWSAQQARQWFLDYGDLTQFEQKVMKKVIPFYCFDTETEVLTVNGWCKRDQVEKGDGIFTVNIETHEIELQEVKDVADFDYDGDLIRIENRNFDALMTPNHRCIYEKYVAEESEFTGEWKIKEAQDLIGSDWLPIATEGWRPKRRAVYSDDFVEMVGWVVCEGSVNDVYVNITQSNKNALERIKWTLLRLGWPYSETKKEPSGCSSLVLRKPQADLFRQLIGNPKTLPLEFLLHLTRPQLELLYEVMVEGDGCWDTKSASAVFLQKDTAIAEAFQMIAALIGKASRLTVKDH